MRVVGECFFWYRLTRVFPDKFHRAVKRLCVVCVMTVYFPKHMMTVILTRRKTWSHPMTPILTQEITETEYTRTQNRKVSKDEERNVLSVENDSDDETSIMTTIMTSSTSQPMTPSLTDMTTTWLLETMMIMLSLLKRRIKQLPASIRQTLQLRAMSLCQLFPASISPEVLHTRHCLLFAESSSPQTPILTQEITETEYTRTSSASLAMKHGHALQKWAAMLRNAALKARDNDLASSAANYLLIHATNPIAVHRHCFQQVSVQRHYNWGPWGCVHCFHVLHRDIHWHYVEWSVHGVTR